MKFPRFPALWRFSEMPSHPSGSKRFGGKYTDKDQIDQRTRLNEIEASLKKRTMFDHVWYVFLPLYQHVSTVPSYQLSPDIRFVRLSLTGFLGGSWDRRLLAGDTATGSDWLQPAPCFNGSTFCFNSIQFPYISINAIYIHHRLLSGPFEAFGTAQVQNVYCWWCMNIQEYICGPPPSNNCK